MFGLMKLEYFCRAVYILRAFNLGLNGGAYSIPTPEGEIRFAHKISASHSQI